MIPEYYVLTKHGEPLSISMFKNDLQSVLDSWSNGFEFKIEGPFHLKTVSK